MFCVKASYYRPPEGSRLYDMNKNVLRGYHERPVQSNALFPQSSFAQKERVHMVERDQSFDKKIKKVI